MIFKILLSRSVQTPNSDKNWQTSCPLQTFVCNISRHLEFIIEWVTGSTVSPGRCIPGSLGRWVTKCDPVPCLVYLSTPIVFELLADFVPIPSSFAGVLPSLDFLCFANPGYATGHSTVLSGPYSLVSLSSSSL